MRMNKEQRIKMKRAKEIVKVVLKISNNWEEMENALAFFYTKLNDLNNPRLEEFNKKYNLIEIFSLDSKELKYKKFSNTTFVSPNIFLYDKAPDGILVMMSHMIKTPKGWLQNGIGLYAKEGK